MSKHKKSHDQEARGNNTQSGHSHHEHHLDMVKDFKFRFWWVLALTIPILALSPMIQDFLGVDWRFSGDIWILAGLSTVVYFFGGWPFLSGLADELKQKRPGMMTLIGLAISVAYFYSVFVVFGLEGHLLFWELSTLVAIMLAAGVLFSWGVILSPAMGAVLMSLSTVIVAINARFLRMGKSSSERH